MKELIKNCLYEDWCFVSSAMIRHLKSGTHGGNDVNETKEKKIRKFGPEKVKYGTYIRINELCMPSMLKYLLFGPLFGKLQKKICKLDEYREVIYRTPHRIIVHIHGHDRLQSLFTIENKSSCSLVNDDYKYMACSKLNINITSSDGVKTRPKAYVISEYFDTETYDVGTIISKRFNGIPFEGRITEKYGRLYHVEYDADGDEEDMNHTEVTRYYPKKWKLLCTNSEENYTIVIDAPTWNKNTIKYKFKDSYDVGEGRTLRVDEYKPVRIEFRKGVPLMTFWCHRCVLLNNEGQGDDEFELDEDMCQ